MQRTSRVQVETQNSQPLHHDSWILIVGSDAMGKTIQERLHVVHRRCSAEVTCGCLSARRSYPEPPNRTTDQFDHYSWPLIPCVGEAHQASGGIVVLGMAIRPGNAVRHLLRTIGPQYKLDGQGQFLTESVCVALLRRFHLQSLFHSLRLPSIHMILTCSLTHSEFH